MAKKGPMPSYQTADDYIAHQPKAAQKILYDLQNIIEEACPEATEIPNSKVPSYTLVNGAKTKLQLMMAAYAKFVSFYPFEKTVEAFTDQLMDYETGKGSIKFPINKPLPKDLILQMVKFRMSELTRN